MAVGNTFGATALSSYGGFWIAYGIMLTPHWNIIGEGGPYKSPAAESVDPLMSESALGFFLTGWFIFTTILLLCTLRSTVMFFLLFFTLDMAFLMLSCSHYAKNNGNAEAALKLTQAGGGFGMIAAFLAWYNAFAGIADSRYVVFIWLSRRAPPLKPWTIHPSRIVPLFFSLFSPTFSRPPAPSQLAPIWLHLPSDPWQATFVISQDILARAHTHTTPRLSSSGHQMHEMQYADATSLYSNSFFLIPVFHFPWSEKGREARLAKVASRTSAAA